MVPARANVPMRASVSRLSREARRNATVLAQGELDCYALGKDDFQAALSTSQSFRDQLYRVYFMRH